MEDGYQLKSGLFISIYLWVFFSLFLLIVIGGSIIAMVCCVQSDAELKARAAAVSFSNIPRAGVVNK